MRIVAAIVLWVGVLVLPASGSTPAAGAAALQPVVAAASSIDPSKLLVRPKKAAPSLWADPLGWVNFQQRAFTDSMRKSLRDLRRESAPAAAWTLIAISFIYGILHAAGPGHGKAVVSAWLLANERQLRRGVAIAFMAAMVQAVTAIALVSTVLFAVSAAGSTARAFAGYLEAASFGFIALVGVYLLWQAVQTWRQPAAAVAVSGHGHTHHDHHHDHDENCGCGHAHLPSAAEVDREWSPMRAISLAVAVGIRPCSGAILALLASSALGIYWAGVVSTFAMALGVAITVSVIAVMAVSVRNVAFRLAGDNTIWLDRTAFGLKLAGGLFIATLGTLLFLNALDNPMSFS